MNETVRGQHIDYDNKNFYVAIEINANKYLNVSTEELAARIHSTSQTNIAIVAHAALKQEES